MSFFIPSSPHFSSCLPPGFQTHSHPFLPLSPILHDVPLMALCRPHLSGCHSPAITVSRFALRLISGVFAEPLLAVSQSQLLWLNRGIMTHCVGLYVRCFNEPFCTDLLNPLIPCRELLSPAFLIHQGIPYHLQEAVCQKQSLRLFFFMFISAFFFDYCTWTPSRQSLRHKKVFVCGRSEAHFRVV